MHYLVKSNGNDKDKQEDVSDDNTLTLEKDE